MRKLRLALVGCGFLGNIIGSIAVGILGNKKSITKGDIMKLVTSLLK